MDYNLIKKYEQKGKEIHANSYNKLLKNLDNYKNNETEITSDIIETEVNKIIDENLEKLKEIKKIEKEISILSSISNRESQLDITDILILNSL